jgi:hypothetical protein
VWSGSRWCGDLGERVGVRGDLPAVSLGEVRVHEPRPAEREVLVLQSLASRAIALPRERGGRACGSCRRRSVDGHPERTANAGTTQLTFETFTGGKLWTSCAQHNALASASGGVFASRQPAPRKDVPFPVPEPVQTVL